MEEEMRKKRVNCDEEKRRKIEKFVNLRAINTLDSRLSSN